MNEVSEVSTYGNYCISDSWWKEIILIWLGREDVLVKNKNEFIEAIIGFEDKIGSNKFYWYRAYFFAGEALAEFNFIKTNYIIEKLIKWSTYTLLNENDLDCDEFLVLEETIKVLRKTNRKQVISILEKLLQHGYNEETRWLAAINLAKVDFGNVNAINTLIELLGQSHSISKWEIYDSLEEVFSEVSLPVKDSEIVNSLSRANASKIG